jgi:hypothetical protein
MPGTLYLLRSNADASLHKIGITDNWPRRAKELQVGLTTACVNRWTVNNHRQLETFLHRRLKAQRLPQSEWFHLSADQVQWVISAAGKAADDLKQATSHQQATQPPRPAAAAGVWGPKSPNGWHGYQPTQPSPAHTTHRQPAPYRIAKDEQPQPRKPQGWDDKRWRERFICWMLFCTVAIGSVIANVLLKDADKGVTYGSVWHVLQVVVALGLASVQGFALAFFPSLILASLAEDA